MTTKVIFDKQSFTYTIINSQETAQQTVQILSDLFSLA